MDTNPSTINKLIGAEIVSYRELKPEDVKEPKSTTEITPSGLIKADKCLDSDENLLSMDSSKDIIEDAPTNPSSFYASISSTNKDLKLKEDIHKNDNSYEEDKKVVQEQDGDNKRKEDAYAFLNKYQETNHSDMNNTNITREDKAYSFLNDLETSREEDAYAFLNEYSEDIYNEEAPKDPIGATNMNHLVSAGTRALSGAPKKKWYKPEAIRKWQSKRHYRKIRQDVAKGASGIAARKYGVDEAAAREIGGKAETLATGAAVSGYKGIKKAFTKKPAVKK